MQTALWICNLIATAVGALFAYRVIFGILGVLTTKRFAPAKKQHRYAIVIAARNEETVIGNLIESINAQDYPRELITTFVVADNCSDRTAEIARRHGAICYERFDNTHCTKGYALEFLFDKIERDYGRGSFEGYIVFDADNLLKRDFIARMNDAFDSGEKVVVSYRNTKNLSDGWIPAGYALHWLRTCRLEHAGRSVLSVASRIQGTGFLFSSDFVRDGWHYTSLTEDRAFSSDIVTQGVNITYQSEALFYDEQPTSLHVAFRQRLRWAKGHLQAFTETAKPLFLGIFRKGSLSQRVSCYDMLTTNMPISVLTVPLKVLEASLIVISCILAGTLSTEWLAVLFHVLQILIFEHFGNVFLGLAIFVLERKRMPRLHLHQYLWYALTFPIFSMIGDIMTLAAIFTKVTWKPIPHKADIRIDQLEEPSEENKKENEKELLHK